MKKIQIISLGIMFVIGVSMVMMSCKKEEEKLIPKQMVEINGITYNLLDWDNTATVIKRNYPAEPYKGNIEIPSIVQYAGRTYTVTAIGDSAFYKSDSLEAVVIPDGVITIGNHAFEMCLRLIDVTLGENIQFIGNNAFYKNDSLEAIIIPNEVIIIGDHAFEMCPLLGNIALGKNVRSIGVSAFSGCHLIFVDIPKSVKMISEKAFYGNEKLDSVAVHWEIPLTITPDVFALDGRDVTLIVPQGTRDLYENAPGWGEFNPIKEEPVIEEPAIEEEEFVEE